MTKELFNDLLGQEGVKSFLQTRLKEKTLPHALLFQGPKGTGKETCSEELAHFLLKGKLTDLHYVKPEEGSSHTMASIRELIGEAYLPPYEADCKVFLIHEADNLSETCQNALLKTLEEPPKNTYLFLLCENAVSLLPTFVSRCILLRFFSNHSQTATNRATELLRKILLERLKYGLSGWHDLLVEIDSLDEKNESELLEEILLWARPQAIFSIVYDLVVEAKEALNNHIRFRHVLESLLLKIPS
jgi:DNA polymerase III delta prime subunit